MKCKTCYGEGVVHRQVPGDGVGLTEATLPCPECARRKRKKGIEVEPREVVWLWVRDGSKVYKWRIRGLSKGAFHLRLESPEYADGIVVGPDVQNAVTITPVTYSKVG